MGSLLGRMCSRIWFPCWPPTRESSTYVACPACLGGVPSRARWAEPSYPCPTTSMECGEEGCLLVGFQASGTGSRGVEQQRGLGSPEMCLNYPLVSNSLVPGLLWGMLQPPLPRFLERTPHVWDHRGPQWVWGGLHRTGVALPVMRQDPTGLGVQWALAAEAGLGCSALCCCWRVLQCHGFVGPQLGLCCLCLCSLSASRPCGRSRRRALWPGRGVRRQQHPQLFKAWNAWSWGLGQALPAAPGGPCWVPWLCSGFGCCGGSSLLGLCARGMS